MLVILQPLTKKSYSPIIKGISILQISGFIILNIKRAAGITAAIAAALTGSFISGLKPGIFLASRLP